mgnify:CR=1 FL=1
MPVLRALVTAQPYGLGVMAASLYGLDIETDTTVDGLDPGVSRIVAVALSTDAVDEEYDPWESFNEKMFGSELYQAFRAVKRAFDPTGMLNPGKVIPTLQRCAEDLRPTT